MVHVLMVLGFIWWWPVGLAILIYLMVRRKRGYCGEAPMMEWAYPGNRFERRIQRAQEKVQRAVDRAQSYYSRSGWGGPPSTGNRAFDEYRAETIRRLEEESHEFHDFLGRLRAAKDRAEFDQFMASRRAAPPAPAEG